MSLTVGIDLASQAPSTAVCVLDWSTAPARVRTLARGKLGPEPLEDAVLLRLARQPNVDKVAIDAPFGWPMPFVEALAADVWPVAPGDLVTRRLLELRATDRFVEEHTAADGRKAKRPLSVSTDKIAMPAMRCAALLAALEVTDRSGTGLVAEAYPDAALREWHLTRRGDGSYKGTAAGSRDRRREVVAALAAAVAFDEHDASCLASDDALDAVVCALIGRAAHLGLTVPPPDAMVSLARREGWIHLPARGSLHVLARGAPPVA